MDTNKLSPKEAAIRAGCGRTSVMRALAAGHLRAIRDNEGQWRIEPEAVDDWQSMRRTHDRQSPVTSIDSHPVTPVDTPETLAKLAGAEARAEALSMQVADLRSERDRLLSMLEKASDLRPNRAGWFDRLLGRT